MRAHITSRKASAGFSLLELLVSVTVLFLVLGAMAVVAVSHERAYQTGATAAQLETQAAQAVERVLVEMRSAGLATLVPDPAPGVGADSTQYLRAVGITAGTVDWSPPRRLAFEYEPGEMDDGLDNNGNGLIDEGQIVLREDFGGPNERALVLSRWVAELAAGELSNGVDDNGNGLVDERGFCVERLGETLIVRLTLQRRDARRYLLSRTARTSTRIRN